MNVYELYSPQFKSLHFFYCPGGLKNLLPAEQQTVLGLATDHVRNLTDCSPMGLELDSMWTDVLRYSSESSAMYKLARLGSCNVLWRDSSLEVYDTRCIARRL